MLCALLGTYGMFQQYVFQVFKFQAFYPSFKCENPLHPPPYSPFSRNHLYIGYGLALVLLNPFFYLKQL